MKSFHDCRREFPSYQIDNCVGIGVNRCYGDDKLVLEVWYAAKDGCGEVYDDAILVDVNYCPYCGFKGKIGEVV
jgi:hypothetical protein